jgi:hypothetical protein
MTLYSFGFAAFLFKAFPLFYQFVIATLSPAAVLWWQHDATAAALLAALANVVVSSGCMVCRCSLRWVISRPRGGCSRTPAERIFMAEPSRYGTPARRLSWGILSPSRSRLTIGRLKARLRLSTSNTLPL